MALPRVVAQTNYAELLQQCESAAFSEDFVEEGSFTPKTINGRKYWYFQSGTGDERKQKYVGPETPELLEKIERHKELKGDEKARRALVSSLSREFYFSRPSKEIGDVIEALAKAGVFRLRGVLIGTAAFQTYAPMLGVKLSTLHMRTDDIDIAQFKNVSVAVEDQTPPALETLKSVDKTFRALPNVVDHRRVTSYAARGGLRVDFLTPNEGAETEEPQALPAFQTDAQPLRFLDYLIHDPQPAALLHNAGVFVRVPSPSRYAIHKLIVSRRRREGEAKRDKDLQQAEDLLKFLIEKRPSDLRAAFEEAQGRGDTWRLLIGEALGQISAAIRDGLLSVVRHPRSIIPGLTLTFDNPSVRYDFDRDVAWFIGKAAGEQVQCEISREALDDHFGTDGLTQQRRVEAVLKNRSRIEGLMTRKYFKAPVQEIGKVILKTADID